MQPHHRQRIPLTIFQQRSPFPLHLIRSHNPLRHLRKGDKGVIAVDDLWPIVRVAWDENWRHVDPGFLPPSPLVGFPVSPAARSPKRRSIAFCNVAKYDLTYSRRRSPNYSGPIPVFFRIITSPGQGAEGKEVQRGAIRARIFQGKKGLP